MSYEFRGMRASDQMMRELNTYIKDGVPPCSFLQSVISNDLIGAVNNADDYNMSVIPAYVAYLFNKAPMQCWATKEKMEAWIK